ncbi:hypothetical protein PCE1_004058 [Barthelona sp. PCE]
MSTGYAAIELPVNSTSGVENRSLCNRITRSITVILLIVLTILLIWAVAAAMQRRVSWKVDVVKHGMFLNETDSVFRWNYNSAYIPLHQPDGTIKHSLAVRCQNVSGPTFYDVGPSYIMFAESEPDGTWSHITMDDVLLAPNTAGVDNGGVEDPRVVYWEKSGFYYMHYTAVKYRDDDTLSPHLAVATSPTGLPGSWTKYGPLWEQNDGDSKSGAVIINEKWPKKNHSMIWGDYSLYWSTSDDMLHWENERTTPWMEVRNDHFDSALVEAGPAPMKLSDGNLLFLYNSAREVGQISSKPGWKLEYNIGFLILDKDDPKKILHRSEEPILSPTEVWEKCDNSTNIDGLTPDVVFVEGMRPIDGKDDSFLVYYQGCDGFMATATFTVSFTKKKGFYDPLYFLS